MKELVGIPKETFNAVVDALGNMPYKQVGQVMDIIRSEATIVNVNEEDPAPAETPTEANGQ